MRQLWNHCQLDHFAAGHALKPVVIEYSDGRGGSIRRQGEFVVSGYGIEGSLVYACSAALRDAIARDGRVMVHLDLVPGRDQGRLANELARPRGTRSLSEHLRRVVGIDGVKAGLLYETLPKEALSDASRVAATLKAVMTTK